MTRVLLAAALCALAAPAFGQGVARPLAEAARQPVADTLRVPLAGDAPSGMLWYRLEPAPSVTPAGAVEGALVWTEGQIPVVPLPLLLAEARSASLHAGRLAVEWPGGQRDTLDLWVGPDGTASGAAPPSAPPSGRPRGQEWASAPVDGLSKEVEVELYGTTRSASPGGLVVVRYSVNSYEEQDERVRLRLHLPPGWTLLDRDPSGEEFLLESWESLEGELRVSVPRSARPGERHFIRAAAEVLGEPGSAEVYSVVQVTRRGGLQAGQVGLTGTASVLASSFGVEDLDGARYGGVVDLSGRITPGATLSIAYRQGPRENALTNYRIAQEDTRWTATLRGQGWQAVLGNQVHASGSALTGPFVRGRGVSARRTEGLVVGEVTVAQPSTFSSAPAGHVVRGSVGLAGRHGRAALVFSDFGRPVAGGYSTAPVYPADIDPEELDRLERERLAAERAPSNRVQGGGLDVELRHGRAHRLAVRGGWLRLANAADEAVSAPSGEVHYALSHARATLNARWRHMPASLAGIHLPGQEVSVDGSAKVVGEWRVAGRAYRTLTETVGNAFHNEGEGASLGLRYGRGGYRIDARGSYRQWSYGQAPTTARTVTLSAGAPLGPLSLSAYADVGEQDNGTVRRPTKSLRGDLRWSSRAGTASWSASYFETLAAPPRLRTDLLGSAKLGDWELAGGAWGTRGLVRGGEPGFWTQLGAPVGHDLLLTLGVERGPRTWGGVPGWLGTVGLRTRLAFALPFLRDGTAAPLAEGLRQ